jgi:membrane protein required for colicin V production
MTWVDYAIIGVIGLSVLVGLVRGLVREILSLAAWIIAIWVAFSFAQYLADALMENITSPPLRLAAAFIALFLITLILAGVVNFFIVKLVSKAGITGADHILGSVFGLARGALIVALLVLLGSATPFAKDDWWQDSMLIGHFQNLAVWLRDLLPQDIAQKLRY